MTERLDSLCVGGDDVFHETNQVNLHNLLLLINVVQNSGKPPPVDSYIERLVAQISDKVAGVQPLSVTVVNEKEAIVELKEDNPVIDISQLIQGLASWEGQSVNVHCMISNKRSLLSIIQIGEEMQNKQEGLEKEQQLIGDEVKE